MSVIFQLWGLPVRTQAQVQGISSLGEKLKKIRGSFLSVSLIYKGVTMPSY